MVAFSDDAYHFQEIKKDHNQTLALPKRLRLKGFQCAAAPSAIKEAGLSCRVLTAIKKTRSAKSLARTDMALRMIPDSSGLAYALQV